MYANLAQLLDVTFNLSGNAVAGLKAVLEAAVGRLVGVAAQDLSPGLVYWGECVRARQEAECDDEGFLKKKIELLVSLKTFV